MTTVFTIGHSNHPLDRFLSLLEQHAIEVLVDVRSKPYSRHAPQYRQRELRQAVESRGLRYVYLGRELGGLPPAPGPELQNGLVRLRALARDSRTAMLCAEEDPARCHRGALIAPALRTHRVVVMHIRGDGRAHPELATPDAQDGQLDLFEGGP